MVVVAPRWATPEWTLSNLEAIGTGAAYASGEFFDVAQCAFAAAQKAATDHGGNPEWTTVEGFSAGVHPAAWVGLGLVRDDPCPDAVTVAPIGLVLGDSNWLFQRDQFDGAFGDESSPGTDTVDRYLNPERWTVPDGFVAYLWSSESTVTERPVEMPPSAESWLRARGDDDLVDDLDSVGALDDGSVGFLDNGLLQHLRMRQAGITVAHEQLPGDHSRKAGMIARVVDVVWQVPLEDN